RRDRILEHVVRFPNLRHDSLLDVLTAIPVTDLKVTAQHFDQGKIGSSLPVRNRCSLQYKPSGRQLVTSKFVHQTRFPHTGLSDQRENLAATGRGLFDKFIEKFDFTLAPDQGR